MWHLLTFFKSVAGNTDLSCYMYQRSQRKEVLVRLNQIPFASDISFVQQQNAGFICQEIVTTICSNEWSRISYNLHFHRYTFIIDQIHGTKTNLASSSPTIPRTSPDTPQNCSKDAHLAKPCISWDKTSIQEKKRLLGGKNKWNWCL